MCSKFNTSSEKTGKRMKVRHINSFTFYNYSYILLNVKKRCLKRGKTIYHHRCAFHRVRDFITHNSVLL